MKNASFLKLGGILFAITAFTALALGMVNGITKDRIAEIKEQKTAAAIAQVMSGADKTQAVEYTGEDATVSTVLEAYSGDELQGWCITVLPNGFGGEIELMIGVDTDYAVTGIVMISHSETAGLGSKADSEDFLGQYVGRSGEITVNTGDNAISAITAATITSEAVTNGTNSAIAAAEYLGGNG